MRLITFISILVVIVVVVESHQYRFGQRPARKTKYNFFKGTFRSIFCRMRHYKTVLNKNNRPESCTRRCATDFIEQYSLYWGHHCRPVVIPEGCADRFCIHCATGYHWLYTFPYQDRCIKKCPAGYMATSSKMCIECNIDGCDRCADMWTCKKCKGDLALFKTFVGSVICVDNCPRGLKTINSSGIKKCVKSVPTTTTVPNKSAPVTTLMTVTEPTPATTLMTATEPDPATTLMTATKLITTLSVKTTKRPVTSKKVILQEGCKDDKCVNCHTGYFKYYIPTKGSYCIKECPIGHTALGSMCVACADRRCASCSVSLAECDKCYPGYSMLLDAFNITLECVRVCPTGYKTEIINKTKLCIPKKDAACPVPSCKQCIRSDLHSFHSGCGECLSGFKLFRGAFNDHCYKSCPAGNFESLKPGTNISVCARCKSPFCKVCPDGNTCTECVAPMVIDVPTSRCTVCRPYTRYSFPDKGCVSTDEDQPESESSNNNIFGLPRH